MSQIDRVGSHDDIDVYVGWAKCKHVYARWAVMGRKCRPLMSLYGPYAEHKKAYQYTIDTISKVSGTRRC